MGYYPRFYDHVFAVTIEDMNFDGLNDFRIVEFIPAAPNIPHLCWV